MTLQEILKAKGVTDENIQAVMDDMKANKIFTTSHENMDVRYPKLKADHENLTAQYGESTKLIDEMKAGVTDNQALMSKITAHEATITQLNEQLKQTQLESAIKVALAGAKATDVDYMTYRLKEKGDLELDDKGSIKGIDEKLSALKTQFPAFFETGAGTGKQIEVQKLPDRKPEGDGMTRAELLRKPYAERAAYANENPEAYKTIMNH